MNFAVRNLGGLIALILLTGCASIRSRTDANNGETVEAEGWAPVDPHDVAGTRERALADAQKKAVEKVTGIFLAASTRVDAAIAVRDRITADVRGSIRHYKILNEKTEEGVYKIRIRAFVARSNHSGMMSPAPNTPPPGSPMVRVLINGDKMGENVLDADAASAIETRLSACGFKISASSHSKSDIQIVGQARASEIKDSRLGQFISFRAKIAIEVLDPETRSVIWNHSEKASALDVDVENASSKAIENAGSLIGSDVASNLTAYLWKQR